MSFNFCPTPVAPDSIDARWTCPLCGFLWLAYAVDQESIDLGAKPFGWRTDGPHRKGCVL